MTINHLLPGQVRAGGIQRPKGEGDSRVKKDSGEAPPKARGDSVDISAEGRVLSSLEGASGSGGIASPESLDQVHRRIGDGTYDSPDVAEEVARRILNSGDLEG